MALGASLRPLNNEIKEIQKETGQSQSNDAFLHAEAEKSPNLRNEKQLHVLKGLAKKSGEFFSRAVKKTLYITI